VTNTHEAEAHVPLAAAMVGSEVIVGREVVASPTVEVVIGLTTTSAVLSIALGGGLCGDDSCDSTDEATSSMDVG
jgi:hypothetical protein